MNFGQCHIVLVYCNYNSNLMGIILAQTGKFIIGLSWKELILKQKEMALARY